jgi:CP family cyanate transporter-like MFS transporter
MNLRSPITAVPTVIGTIRADLGLSPTVVALLTSIPVLCFGLLTPLASLLISRTGVQRAILATLAGAMLGTLLRPLDGAPGMLLGTLLLGASLTIGNIVSLQVIARDFPKRMGMVTGLYTAAMGVGTMFTSSLTAPLAELTSWRLSLASWVWMPLLTFFLWLAVNQLRCSLYPAQTASGRAPVAHTAPDKPLHRMPIVWLLSIALLVHLFNYYGITAWLPTYLMERNAMTATQAGLAATVFQVMGMLGSFCVPVLVRYWPLGRLLSLMGVLWMATPLWILLGPSHWLAWSILAGIPQGGSFVTIFMLIMNSARNIDENRRLSTVIQGVGYAFASLGPVVIGYLRERTSDWSASFLLMSALPVCLIVIGFAISALRKPAQARV